MLTDTPFVLLDDARATGAGPASLYRHPVDIIETRDPAEVRASLALLRDAGRRGLHAAGFLSYEAGLTLEDRLMPLAPAPAADAPPLLWFGLFETCEEIAPDAVAALLPDPLSGWAAPPEPLIARADYEAAVAKVKAHIEAGDIYQANLTFPARVRTAGAPLAIYAALRDRARAGHGGIVHTGAHWLLSFSPELFFTLEGRTLVTRPMKGTAERGADAIQDAAMIEMLRTDPKQRAENLMIVDLLRNDLSRVAAVGSVDVPSLFAIETFPTVHQMTSTVTATLDDGLDAIDVLHAIYPCGSITGAPKIRAMEIIADIEGTPRGVYTGSIGRLAPDGETRFSVAIRTLTLNRDDPCALMGLGSGVVADSRADDEWRECLAKGAFVADATRGFDLIETMLFDPENGVADVERHLNRMKASAQALGFSFDRHDARNELQASTFRLREHRKLRLMLSRTGALAIETRPMPDVPHGPVEVAVLPLPVDSGDFRLRHKTSDRAFYDDARRAAGSFEVLFVDQEGFLTEGSFTSVYVAQGGTLLTPPATRALLPSVLREKLIAEGKAIETELRPEDLSGGFFVGNAVRGLLPAIVRAG